MRLRLFAFAAALTLFCTALPGARAGENVWSGLVLATNVAKPGAAPPEMHGLRGTLERTFGYNQFELIGQSRKALKTGEENWLASSKHFSLHVDARGATRDGYRLKLQLYQDRQVLLETDANLSKSSPLVVKVRRSGPGSCCFCSSSSSCARTVSPRRPAS
ncbi:MAG: hypothetical protein ABIR29_10555 [Chthoniobacterales bacterium]